MHKNRHRVVLNAALVSTILLSAFLLPAQAQIAADPSAPGNQRPTILTAPNGVPLVNIQTPSPAGVSRNTYRQFDVNAPGAILNNSRTNVPTQLGGWVPGNPWLATGGARVILNEVNSTNPSYLNGPIEVAGQRAEVIIANPAGIQVNGLSFINATGVTITTGKPVMNQGALESFRVQGGQVRIEGLGLDARATDFTNILTRAMEVNAAVWANRLNMVLGAAETKANTLNDPNADPVSTPIEGVGPKPTVRLDVGAIGGMYAGKIFLVGTEKGLGVNNGGVISARQDLVLLPNGMLINRGSVYGQNIQIEATEVRNEGGDKGGGVIAARDSLTINAEQIHNTEGAELLSLGKMELNASERIENRSARIEAQGKLNITTPVLINANDHFETELVSTPGARYLRVRHAGVDYKAEDLGMNFDRLDRYDDQAGWRVVLPSAEYPFSQYPALVEQWAVADNTGPFHVELSRTELSCMGSECGLKRDVYAMDHPIWQRFGVTSPGPAPEPDPPNPNPNCDQTPGGCVSPQWAQYNARKLAAQNQLDQKITAFNDSVTARTLQDWVVIDATATDHNPRVVNSAPGQIVSGGDMALNVSTQLLNHNSEILAGGALKVQGVAIDNRGTDVIARTELNGQAVHSVFRDEGFWKNNDRLYEYAPYQAVQERGTHVNVARSDGGQTIPAVITSALFKAAPDPASGYLIETDPLFTNQRQWLGSDYLINAMSSDPNQLQKRLGDGFYEQRLIREQVGQLTGQRFLGNYTDDEAQFLALMNSGLTFAQAYPLHPGIALSAEQMAALTSDIVWLVAEDVTLPDGRKEKALVPRVYLAPRAGDLSPSGALIAGNTVNIHMSGDVLNSGTIAGRQLVQVTAGRDIEHTGKITTQGTAVLSAARDIQVAGGEIRAVDAIVLDAGRDLDIASTTRNTRTSTTFERTGIDRQARLYLSGEAGVILASAGRDVTLTAADIRTDGPGSSVSITAERDLNLSTVSTSATDDLHWDAENRQRASGTQDVGTRIDSAGDIDLKAGRDLNARAANVQAQGDLRAQAARDLNITAGQQTLDFADAHHKESSGFLSSSSVTTRSTVNTVGAVASELGGRTVDIRSGQDLTVQGSNVVSDQGTYLQAGRDVSITAAQTTSSSTNFRKEESSGLMDSDQGFMLGSQQQSTEQQRNGVGAAASTVGAVDGDVTIVAGRHYRQVGSDVIAAGDGGDVTVVAQDIKIIDARTTERNRREDKASQSGISVGAGGAFIEAAQGISNTLEATDKTESIRMKALGVTAASMQAYDAGKAIAADPQSAVGITFTLGSSSSKNTSEREENNARGSSVSAGGDVRLIASGAGKDSDILVRGSQVKAGDTALLYAEGDIHLSAAKNTAKESNRSENSNASVSATYNGSWSFSASASSGKGAGDGEEVTHTNTRIEAGKLVQIESDGDTTLNGAVVAANTVKAKVGGNLVIQSLQDTSVWREKSSQQGGSASSSGGASASASQTKIDADYASVGEQSGIRAGDGGFQVEVKGHTDLKGGMLASSERAADGGLNSLTTATLSHSDLQNSAHLNVESSGVSLSTDMATQGKYGATKAIVSNGLNNADESSSSNAQTRATVSAGSIVITDAQAQLEKTGQTAGQTVASLNRDAGTANTAAQKQDVQAVKERVEAERAVKQAVVAAAIKFTDETYRTMFLEVHPVYEVVRDENGKVLVDPATGKPVERLLSDEEKRHLKPGPDGKVHIAANGIFNDAEAAGGYANQHSSTDGPQYLIHFPEADNTVSELLVAGYQKYLENDFLGLTNSTTQVVDYMKQYGQEGLHLDGHSRGSMTIGNALESMGSSSGGTSPLSNTSINFYGPAYKAEDAARQLSDLSGGLQDSVGVQNHVADPVGRLGGNPSTGGTIPEGSSPLNEAWRAATGQQNTSHNCYGSHAPAECQRLWMDSNNLMPQTMKIKPSNSK